MGEGPGVGSVGFSVLGPLKNQSRLRFEGPPVALGNGWRGVFVCVHGGGQFEAA